MEKIKVALLFDRYEHPTQPYLKVWADHLFKSGKLKIGLFTMNKSSGGGAKVLGSMPLKTKLKQLYQLIVRQPALVGNYALQKTNGPLRQRLARISEYAPLLEFGPDIVHFVNSSFYLKVANSLPHSGFKSIVSFRGLDISIRPWVDPQWMTTLQTLFANVDVLHFVSRALMEEGVQLGAPRSKCRVIYPSVDVSNFDAEIVRSNPKRIKILSVGSLRWQKGYKQALLVVKKLVDSGVDLEYSIIGDGQDREHLIYLIRSLGLGDKVQLRGVQPSSVVRQALKDADIYFHPSESEAGPVALMEASAIGKPIITSDVGGIPEMLEHDVTGFLLPSFEIDQMVAAFIKLIENPDLRVKLGTEAQKMVRTRFSVESEYAEWENLYLSLA
jgi:colanic acid/amylovoran biosynthesis glycosyltransferase